MTTSSSPTSRPRRSSPRCPTTPLSARGPRGCGDFDGAPDGDGSGKTQEWYERGFRDKYLPHVIKMTTRYKDSPAIAMWEIINEPGEADWATIRDFLHEVAAVIKQHDPNHLVESGTFAGWAYEGYENYRAMHDNPNIDVGNLHEYDYDYQESNTIESPHDGHRERRRLPHLA